MTDSSGITPHQNQKRLDEVAQAKIRNYLHVALVALTLAAYRIDPEISLFYVSVVSAASLVAALGLYIWASTLARGSASSTSRFWQRVVSTVSDNLFITLVLLIGGANTAGIWALYIWISIGYGVRYGVRYLFANVVASVFCFAIVFSNVPFWQGRPSFSFGLSLAMIVVPLYVGWLITQLHTAVREREIAYAAKSDFIARMSHELRTPLHAIISTADLLRDRVRQKDEIDLADLILVSSNTLLDLINRVLDLSKFEANQYKIEESPIDLHKVIGECTKIIFPEATRKGIDLLCHIDTEVEPKLFAPPEELKEILLNLLGNSVKFTAEGSVSLNCFCVHDSEEHVQLRFEIRDTGPGIAPEKLESIMEPFVQEDDSITRSFGGSGLGTSFARELVRAMGGTISVSSSPGSGTTFIVDLTLRKQNRTDSAESFSTITLLVLAEPEAARQIAPTLENLNASIRIANSIDEALLNVQSANLRDSIDGAIIQVGDDFESINDTILRLRRSGASRIFPVFGVGDLALRTTAKNAGCIGFSTLPLTETTARRLLGEVLAIASARDDATAKFERDLSSSQSLRVLIADDDSTNRSILRTILEMHGHAVTETDNGDDAMFALSDQNFDLAILDMHMPKRDGIEVLNLYGYMVPDSAERVPIILFTADSTLRAKELAKTAGAARFLTKPIRPRDLVASIYDVVYKDVKRRKPQLVSDFGVTTVSARDSGSSREVAQENPSRFKSVSGSIDDETLTELLSFMTKEEQREFFGEFFEDAWSYIDSYTKARNSDECVAAQAAMHSLAGAAVTVGARNLAEIAQKIEMMTSEQALGEKTTKLEVLKREMARAQNEINRRFLNVSA